MSERLDLVGKRFGRLVGLSYVRYEPKRHASMWLFRCDCGKEISRAAGMVLSGKTRSCGCYNRELISTRYLTHGFTISKDPLKVKIYQAWANMRRRCFDLKNISYPRYGGRGITVCKRWLKFERFLSDMGLPPSVNHSIDRIDNDGDYTPKNCTWKTSAQQNTNYSRNVVIEYRGENKSLGEWVKSLGLSYAKVHQRINKLGWPANKAFETD